MPTTAPKRTSRINLRTTPATETLIRAGAKVRGINLSEFILESARDRAEQVIADRTVFSLSPARFNAFVAALDRQPLARPKPRLQRLLKEKFRSRVLVPMPESLHRGTEKLRVDHDLAEFDCGIASLNEWLIRFAWQNQRAGAAQTYVALRDKRVVGYYSLVAGSVQRSDAPERVSKGLANHPIGVILLARLAVDRREQGSGLGQALLKDALARIAQAADIIGVRAVLVHAINENAKRFYMHFNFEPSLVDPMHLMLLIKDLKAMVEH